MKWAHLLAIALVGCGSSTADPPVEPAADSGNDPFASTGATGTFGSRDEACARVAAAFASKSAALGCPVDAKCPAIVDDLERKAGLAGECIEYDLGTVANCEARIASYETCADFNGEKNCQLTLRRSATGVCSSADAASDGG